MDFGRFTAHIKFSHSIVTRFTTNICWMSPTSNTLHWLGWREGRREGRDSLVLKNLNC